MLLLMLFYRDNQDENVTPAVLFRPLVLDILKPLRYFVV